MVQRDGSARHSQLISVEVCLQGIYVREPSLHLVAVKLHTSHTRAADLLLVAVNLVPDFFSLFLWPVFRGCEGHQKSCHTCYVTE